MSIPSEQACLTATGTNQDKARICSLFCESGRIPFAVLIALAGNPGSQQPAFSTNE